MASPVQGQTPSSLDSVRAAMRDLELKLRELERPADDPFGSRTTRIGESKPAPKPVDDHELVVQLYDLSDLFAIAPAYPALHQSDLAAGSRALFPVVDSAAPAGPTGGFGGGFGGGGFGGGGGSGGGMFSISPDVRHATSRNALFQFGASASDSATSTDGNLAGSRVGLEDLMQAIQTTIEPGSWSDAGGESSMARLGNTLLISATKRMHQQIGELMKLFRARWGTLRTVSVRAYWLWLTEQQLDGLLVQNAGEADPKSPEPRLFGVVHDDAWRKLLIAPAASDDDGTPQPYFAAITSYNGQTVHALAGSHQSIVTGVTPVVGGGEQAPSYAPITSVVQGGAALQVTPLTSTHAKYVVLDVHSRVAHLIDQGSPARTADDKPARSGPAHDAVSAVDRPLVSTHRLSTTLRVPTGKVYLVGGMSGDRSSSPASVQLYLFVQAFVQELRDDPHETTTEK